MDRINWVTNDCFNALLLLARMRADEPPRPELIHQRMRGLLDALAQKARTAGYADRDVSAIVYALVALTDELMMAKSQAFRDYWASQQLQLLYFKENLAGEGFFRHLEQVRQSAAQVDVLRVFYLCLLFGFQGRFGVAGGDAPLAALRQSIRAQLGNALPMPEVLAPSGLRPEEGFLETTRRLPIVWIASGCVVLTVVLYLGLAVSLREQTTQLVVWMAEVTGS